MKLLNKSLIAGTMSLLLVTSASALDNMFEYWITPNNIHRNMSYSYNGGTPGPSGAMDWTGTLWGRTIEMQGGKGMLSGDIHQIIGTDIYYYGTFRGNWNTADKSAFFLQPVLWMHQTMNVGDTIDTTHQYYNLDPKTRQQYSNPLVLTKRTKIFDHYDTYTVPETGVTYNDVIYFGYWPNINDQDGLEEYWCARGLSWVRGHVAKEGLIKWAVPDQNHPNGAPWGYGADGIDYNAPVSVPQNPWYSPFLSQVGVNQTYDAYVWNGSFEDDGYNIRGWYTPYPYNSPNTGPSCYIDYDTPSSLDNESGFDEAGSNSLALVNAGDLESLPDHIQASSWQSIPVVPGETYKLSGWIKRTDASTSAYILVGSGGSFAQATSTQTGNWEKVSMNYTAPAGVYYVSVTCRLDGDTYTGVSYFDDIRLQLAP